MSKRDNKVKIHKAKVEYYLAKIEQTKNPRTHTERMMLRMYKDMLNKHEMMAQK